MQRMLQSLDPQQRADLADAMAQAMADSGLREQMDQFSSTCRPCVLDSRGAVSSR
jgi:hypothetical protein